MEIIESPLSESMNKKDIEYWLETNSVNHIVLKNGRRYQVHDIRFMPMLFDDKNVWVDLKGQTEGCNNPNLNNVSERIAFCITEIDYIETEYS